MTRGMRKAIAGMLLVIAASALAGLVAVAFGADLGAGGRPMVLARALVLSLGLFVVTLRWRERTKGRD